MCHEHCNIPCNLPLCMLLNLVLNPPHRISHLEATDTRLLLQPCLEQPLLQLLDLDMERSHGHAHGAITVNLRLQHHVMDAVEPRVDTGRTFKAWFEDDKVFLAIHWLLRNVKVGGGMDGSPVQVIVVGSEANHVRVVGECKLDPPHRPLPPVLRKGT
jgi:hypothetical protein